MRWRLILEEYNTELIYIQGSKNFVADALSRLDILDTNIPIMPNMSSLAEHFSFEKEDVLHSVNYKTIMKYQQDDKPLIETAKLNKDYSIKHFHGADKKYSFICRKHKIVIPKLLEKKEVEWYHNALCHPGETRTELSIARHFYWKYLRKIVHEVCAKCPISKKKKETIREITT